MPCTETMFYNFWLSVPLSLTRNGIPTLVLYPNLRPSLQVHLYLVSLSISLSGIVAVVNNQVLRSVIELIGEIRLQDSLGTICVTLLRIQRSTGLVRNLGVSSTEGVLCGTERVVFWCRLREPNVSSVTAEVA